jgi:hypothetical protein
MANPTELTSIFETLVKEINEAGQSDLLKGSVGSIKDLQAVLKEQDKLIDKTLRAGDQKAAMRIIKSAKQAQEAQVEATNNLRDAKEKLLKLEQEGNTKARDAQLKVIGKINQEINKLAREAKLMQKNAAEFGKGAEYSLLQYSRVLENREERIKELGKTGALIEEKFSNRFEGAVNAFTSGVGDLNSFGDTFTGGLKTLGSYLQERKGKLEEKGSAGKGGLGIARMLGGLSKVMSTLAVVGGSIMMMVKLFQFVEGTVLEANKALLEGGVAINDINLGTGDTQKNLAKIRDTFRDPDFANAMGIPLEDTMALVAGFNSLNMGIKQFGGGEESMVKMKEAMKDAKGMAYGLGISMDEAQQYMAKFSHDLGVSAKDGSIIGKMAGDFANIRDMALQSSYSTGNFFKKVEELSDSLENMNYRSKEAGTLFLRFASVLGKSGLDKALQSLFSGFRSEGYLEQMKRNMLSKSKEVKKALKVEAIKFGKSFKESFGGEDGEGGMNAKLMAATKSSSQEQLIQNLAKMDEKGRQDLFTRMKKEGADAGINTDEFTDQLYKFIRLARGTKDKATGAEVQGAQEEMGASGNLKTKFALIEARVGDKNINDAGVITKEMLTKFDVTKEQIELFGQLQTTMKGDMREAQRIAKDAKKENRELNKEEKDFLAKQGLEAKDGKIISLETKTAIENFSDYLQTQDSAKFEPPDTEEAAKTQEQYLSEGVNATTSVFNVLNNTIAGILNDISGGIYSMVTFFTSKGEDKTEKKNKKEAVRIVGERLKALSGQRKEQDASIKAEKERLHDLSFKTKGMKAKEKEKYEKDKKALAEKEKDLVELKARESRSREQLRTLQTTTYDKGLGKSYTTEEMLDKSGKASLETRKRTGTETGALGDLQEKQKLFYAPIADIIGDTTTKALLDYLAKTNDIHVDSKIVEFLAKNDLSVKRTQTETGGRFSGEGRVEQRLLKNNNAVAKLSRAYNRESGRETARIYDTQEGRLTTETIKELNAPLPKSQRDKEAQDAVKATEKLQIEIQTKAILRAAKETKEDELKAVAKALGLSANANPDRIAKQYANASEAQKGKLKALSIQGNETVRRLMGHSEVPTPASATPAKPVGEQEDFWIDGKGNLWSIDPQDFPTPLGGGGLAMTKPGGPVAEYVNTAIRGLTGLGGGQSTSPSGNFNITVNVDGSKNPVDTGRQVVQEIKRSQEKLTGTSR